MGFTLDDVQEHTDLLPPRILLYSPHGVGKTTFGATAAAPVFAQTEEGLGNLFGAKKLPFIKSYGMMVDAIQFMFGEHPFRTFVVDTLDWLEPLVWAETCAEHGKSHIEEFGYGKGFKYALGKWQFILDGLTALQQQRQIPIILLAHSEIKRFDSPEIEPYDRYQPKLHQGASYLVQEWADIVLFANFKTAIEKTDVGFQKKVARGTGTGQRIIYTEERPAFYAKNRYQLPAEIPFPASGAHRMIIESIFSAGRASAAPEPVEQQPTEKKQKKKAEPAEAEKF